jgi:nucleotide-binding universal stress UspA family protein
MFTHILVPVESATQTSRVVSVVRLLAAHGPPHSALTVTLVRAHPGGRDSDDSHDIPVTNAELEQLAGQLWEEGVDAHYVLEFDTPETGILDAARHTCADLIVLMPHGRHGLDALMHPSVTAKLLASATAPLLIWPQRLPGTCAQDVLRLPDAMVILPLDGSERAERALPYAGDVANTFGRTLLVARVIPDVTPLLPAVAEGAFVTPEVLQAKQEAARHYLTTVRERYALETGAPIQSMLLSGAPAHRILDLAEAHPGSVIVMSTHGRSPLARAALGSVTRETIQDTTTPILVIPPHAPAPLARTALLKRPTVTVAHE